MILLISLLFVLILLSSCTDLKPICCKECSQAFGKSPVAVGPEGAQCGTFTTAQPLSERCEKYFESKAINVAECRSISLK